ncbi:MAG: LysM peptidoglycan-binding domain-containing protein [Phycisphaeraceae bacterium JB051]
MKVHYKIALFAAVVFFVVVGGYFLTRGSGVDQTDLVENDIPAPTATASTNQPETPASPSGSSSATDLNSLVRQQLAQINQTNKTTAPTSTTTPKPISPAPITSKPLSDSSAPSAMATKPVVTTPKRPTVPATLTFDGTPVDDDNVLTTDPVTQPVSVPVVNNDPPKPVLVPAPPKPINPPTPAVRASSYPNTYAIQSGDTLSSIALTLYGSDRHWVEIAQANPTIDPLKLKPGQTIKLPQPAELRKSGSQRARVSADGRVRQYTVRAGDNLSTIAQEFYNNASLWRRIYNANKAAIGANPDTLQAGVTLEIPPADSGSKN